MEQRRWLANSLRAWLANLSMERKEGGWKVKMDIRPPDGPEAGEFPAPFGCGLMLRRLVPFDSGMAMWLATELVQEMTDCHELQAVSAHIEGRGNGVAVDAAVVETDGAPDANEALKCRAGRVHIVNMTHDTQRRTQWEQSAQRRT